MKNFIKKSALNALIITVFCTQLIQAGPLENVLTFAKKMYNFTPQYPVILQTGLKPHRDDSPAGYFHKIAISDHGLATVSKEILFDHDYFHQHENQGMLKRLTAMIMHEHTHLDQNHGMQRIALQIQVEQALQNKKSIGIDGKPFTPELFEAKMLELNRHHEYLADTGIRPYKDLCLDQHEYFKDLARIECEDLRTALMQENNPARREVIKTVLSRFNSNDPELLKTIENGEHPSNKRRALYFKQWAEEGGFKQT